MPVIFKNAIKDPRVKLKICLKRVMTFNLNRIFQTINSFFLNLIIDMRVVRMIFELKNSNYRNIGKCSNYS